MRHGKKGRNTQMVKTGKRLAAALVCLCLVLCGCQAEAEPAESGAVETPALSTVDTPAPNTSQTPAPEASEAAPLGSGEIVYEEGTQALNGEQEELLLTYLIQTYEGLARLEVPDLSALFTTDLQAQSSQSVIALQIGMRTLIDGVDYSLVGYHFTLICREVEVQEDGTVAVAATLETTENFAQTPQVDSQRSNRYHFLTLEEVDGAWRIQRHMQYSALYGQLMRAAGGRWEDGFTQAYIDAVPAYLETLAGYQTARDEQRGLEAELPTADVAYDREGALAYADQYAMGRNGDWADYTGSGGNCQNYVSQCLLAGGIPMDTQGDAVWKWYGSGLSNAPGAEGRSSSWTSVTSFRQYAMDNTGFGLVALVDAPYYTGQPGDLIQMGTEDAWRHTVIITQAVTDGAGETVDYLVDSNTSDMRDYPASLYGYPVYSLTHIVGWDNG